MLMQDLWSYEFMRYALLSACILGPVCALLGVFVTLRGMAFFSDALAHSAVTGVALGFLAQERLALPVDPYYSLFLFSFALAGLMVWLFHYSKLPQDTIISFTFTGSVALGVVIISALGEYRLLDGMLFGSIYSNGKNEVILQATFAALIVCVTIGYMRHYALLTICPETAHVQGIRVQALNFLFAMLLAALVAVGMKMLGALLLSALIVIPSAAGRLISRSFRGLLLSSMVGGLIAAVMGVIASWFLDIPTGPCIVLTNVLLFFVCLLWGRVRA
jgi:zinc transport system permease protein